MSKKIETAKITDEVLNDYARESIIEGMERILLDREVPKDGLESMGIIVTCPYKGRWILQEQNKEYSIFVEFYIDGETLELKSDTWGD